MYDSQTRLFQSIKADIGKPFDKSITIDNSNLNVIDFIDQSIEKFDKFDKFDKIDNNNLKIDNYRLLTTYPFIDFYRFPLQLTNFYRFYQLSSIIGFID